MSKFPPSLTERELLEYAAKSIELEYEWKHDAYFGGEIGVVPTGYKRCWNPLRRDDDAFRLMVELGLSLEYLRMWVDEIDPDKKVCFIQWAPGGIQCRVLEDLFDVGSDSCEITRRGIVKAAAEIGRRKSG
jgi:hypothetical protein